MPVQLVTIPCLSDNYSFLIHDDETGETAVVDVPEAGPIADALEQRGWVLSHVLLTHHHWDHIDGLTDLIARHPAAVFGAAADAHRLPPLDQELNEGDTIAFGADNVQVMDVSGHTNGHIAFYLPKSKLLFSADSLMALGCGRLFEGTPDQMFASLSKMAALPPETTVCSGHEYTQSNGKFALTVDPDNAALTSRIESVAKARAAGQPTVPSTLAEELATNPFLRGHTDGVQKAVDMVGAAPAKVFAEVRKRKDNF